MRLTADFWSGLALVALAAYIIVQARQWDYLGADGPGPGFFPLWYGIAMAALAIGLIVSSLVRRAQPLAWRGVGRALATWLAFAVAIAACKPLGFIVSFALFTFFIVAVMYRRPLLSAATIAAGAGAGFYLVFALALGVRLPTGVLGF